MQISPILVSSQATPQPTPQSSLTPTNSNPAVGFSIALGVSTLVIWGVRFYRQYSKKLQRELSLASCAIPCRGCRYFNNNPYLKCTVNPTVVLTEAALDCSDYNPADKKSSLLYLRR